MTWTPKDIAEAMFKKAVEGWRCEDPTPAWAGPDPERPVEDTRPLAKVIALFPQPDGTRCACETWGQASCRLHQLEVRK
jgi:hypothetical protein